MDPRGCDDLHFAFEGQWKPEGIEALEALLCIFFFFFFFFSIGYDLFVEDYYSRRSFG